MKKKYPTTVEEAMALQEVPSLMSAGLYFGAGGAHGDQIVMFMDADGQLKTVHCIRRTPDGPDEWVKTPRDF